MNINGINFKSEMLEDYIVKTLVDKNMCGITGVYAMCYKVVRKAHSFRCGMDST